MNTENNNMKNRYILLGIYLTAMVWGVGETVLGSEMAKQSSSSTPINKSILSNILLTQNSEEATRIQVYKKANPAVVKITYEIDGGQVRSRSHKNTRSR
jgi:hypothetical protein